MLLLWLSSTIDDKEEKKGLCFVWYFINNDIDDCRLSVVVVVVNNYRFQSNQWMINWKSHSNHKEIDGFLGWWWSSSLVVKMFLVTWSKTKETKKQILLKII